MFRPSRLRLRALFGAAALAVVAPCCAQVRDVEMKAAYIYNFAQFTTWPDTRARLPFRVCADGASALWASLQAYNGKQVNGRSWSTAELAAHPSCDLLVVARSAAAIPAAQGMLVVRDGPGLAPAMITLDDGDEHIRFDIDTREAARNGLRFSSKLLRLARTVL
jgi:hypothetical protein